MADSIHPCSACGCVHEGRTENCTHCNKHRSLLEERLQLISMLQRWITAADVFGRKYPTAGTRALLAKYKEPDE